MRCTAAAVYSFAFNKPAPLVDANVARVIARLYHYEHRIDTSADDLLDQQQPRDFNSALMELGQTICKPRAPRCGECPVADWCRSFQQDLDPAKLPIKKSKLNTVLVDEYAIWANRADGAVFLLCETGTRRKGLWKLPLRDADSLSEHPMIYRSTYGFTHHRVTLTIHQGDCSEKPCAGEFWIAANDLPSTPIASPFRKALHALLHHQK